MQLVRVAHPKFPSTQPLELPVTTLADAARIVFDDPIYLDRMGELWITRADAPAVTTLLQDEARRRDASRRGVRPRKGAEPIDNQVHITRDHIAFAFMTFDDTGQPQRQVVVRRDDNTHELISFDGRIDIGTPGHAYDWSRATWVPRERDSVLVVPTERGISIFRPQARPMELHQDFLADGPTTVPATYVARTAKPQYLLDPRGMLAWVPWENDQPGSRGAFRYLDGKWQRLDGSNGWPERIVHLLPMLDGSVLVLSMDDIGNVGVSVQILDTAAIAFDEAKLADLVHQLSDEQPEVRQAAHAELSRYGPQVWPILEKLHPQQPAEGQVRIEQLLTAKQRPMLGRLQLQEGPVHVVGRRVDGGALIWSEVGALAPSPDPAQPGMLQSPAWISVRADRPIELAPPALVNDLDPKRADVTGFGDEWIVTDEVNGPQRFLGNHLVPLLRKSERETFGRFVGVDSRGRWLFRRATRAHTTDNFDDGPTLVIDPWLPDATPRLPAWQYPVQAGVVGWTGEDWPVVKAGSAWVIDRDGTRPLKESEFMFNDLREMPEELAHAATFGPATQPSTQPTTRSAATAPSTRPTEPPIGFDSSGGLYHDGRTTLRRFDPDGTEITWPLPAEANGSWTQPRIVEAEGWLFLFNEAGRVLRLRRTPAGEPPFELDATFTRNIPNIDDPTRIWLDPASRIVVAYHGNQLVILFPTGRIPPAISQRMLAQDLKANEPE